MPRISTFYGIIVWMYWKDHNPPHIHANYGEFEILIDITDYSVYGGYLPSRAFGLLMEWVSIHQEELLNNWELMRQSLPLKTIAPLQ